MSHRSELEEPIYMKKSLMGEELFRKNLGELMRLRGLSKKTAMQLMYGVNPKPMPVTITERMPDGGIRARSVELRPYCLGFLHDRCCAQLTAARDSGKSVLMYQLLATKAYIPTVHVTSTTDGMSGFYQTVVPENQVRTEYDPDHQMAILRQQEACTDLYKSELQEGRFFDPRCILIEDDCTYDAGKVRGDKALNRLATTGRHFHTAVFVMTQDFKAVSAMFRKSVDLLIVFATDNVNVKEHIWREFGMNLTKESFLSVWDEVCGTPYHALIISCRGEDRFKPFEKRVYTFKAYQEEAVDALMGGGRVDMRTGKVVDPPEELWQMGKPTDRMPLQEAQYEVDRVEVQRRAVAEGGEDDDLAEGESLETPEDKIEWFEPSPWSLSEELYQQRADEERAAVKAAAEGQKIRKPE